MYYLSHSYRGKTHPTFLKIKFTKYYLFVLLHVLEHFCSTSYQKRALKKTEESAFCLMIIHWYNFCAYSKCMVSDYSNVLCAYLTYCHALGAEKTNRKWKTSSTKSKMQAIKANNANFGGTSGFILAVRLWVIYSIYPKIMDVPLWCRCVMSS